MIESPSKAFVNFVVTFSYEAQVIKDKLESLTVLPLVGAGGNIFFILLVVNYLLFVKCSVTLVGRVGWSCHFCGTGIRL